MAESVDPVVAYQKAKNNKLRTSGQVAKSLRKRAELIEFVQAGMAIMEACDQIGVSYHTYCSWRQKDEEFKTRVDAARIERMETGDLNWSGGFAAFRKRFFGMDTYTVHTKIIDAIENAPSDSVTLINVPPEHGKTTLVEDWVGYKLATDPNHRVAIVSEGTPLGRKICGRIRRRMSERSISAEIDRYISQFGPFYEKGMEKKGKPWGAEYFTVARANHDERDYSVEVRGWSSTIAGSRYNTIIVDDIQSRRSLNQTDKMVATFRQDIVSRLSLPGTGGRIIVVGTRVDLGDFYDVIEEEGIVDRVVRLPAIDEDGNALCPELWPAEALQARRKKVGEAVWACTYQQEPKAMTEATFNEEMLDSAKSWHHFVKPTHSQSVVMGLDPALGGGNALVACSYTPDTLTILDAEREFGLARTEEILGRVDHLAGYYHPQDLVVERTAFQRGLARDDRMRKLAREHGFRVREHDTQWNKADPTYGVASMAGSFLRGEIVIPWGNDHAPRRMEPLVNELARWRPGVKGTKLEQDLVMALWFCWLWWQHMRTQMGLYTAGSWQTSRLPWSPTSVVIGR